MTIKIYIFSLIITIVIIIFISCPTCEVVSVEKDTDDKEKETINDPLPFFPEGWVDSPFVVPDESALYFMHSVADITDVLTQNENAQPIAEYLPDHHGQDSTYWWTPDIYVSQKNPDGTWGWPINLGDNINTYHIEHCVWVSSDQKFIIFMRDAVDGNTLLTGNYLSTRDSTDDPWGPACKMPDNVGDYLINKYTNLHMTPSVNIYLEGETSGSCDLYFAENTGESVWADPVAITVLNTTDDDTQLWINNEETRIYYNRRDTSGDTILLLSTRDTTGDPWGDPAEISLTGFENQYGTKIWGEPSFILDESRMYFVKGAETYLYRADKNAETFGPPVELTFIK